jgi:hypothetical protein
MKIRWNHRYVQLGVTAFLVIAASYFILLRDFPYEIPGYRN